MTSQARVSANRRNAEKSTGPCTTQGKAIVARNALKHGLLARQDVVMGEDPQEFELLRRRLLADLEPWGEMETLFAGQIASLWWRLLRAQRVQNETFDYLLARELKDSLGNLPMELSPADEERMRENPETDPRLAVGRMVWRDYRDGGALDRLMQYERRIESSLHRTMKELQALRLGRKQGTVGHSEPITDSVKQSQRSEMGVIVKAEGLGDGLPELPLSHRQAALDDATHAGVQETGTDCVKQSQPAADGGYDEATGPDTPPCETKPIPGGGETA
jgi:hypothetical protein